MGNKAQASEGDVPVARMCGLSRAPLPLVSLRFPCEVEAMATASVKAGMEFKGKGKGFKDDWIAQQVYNDLQSLGYSKIRLGADTGPSIRAMLQKFTDLRDHRGSGAIHVDDAVAGQPQANGVAEKVVQDVTSQARKYKIAIGRATQLGIGCVSAADLTSHDISSNSRRLRALYGRPGSSSHCTLNVFLRTMILSQWRKCWEYREAGSPTPLHKLSPFVTMRALAGAEMCSSAQYLF